jgi:hypothetical protein
MNINSQSQTTQAGFEHLFSCLESDEQGRMVGYRVLYTPPFKSSQPNDAIFSLLKKVTRLSFLYKTEKYINTNITTNRIININQTKQR